MARIHLLSAGALWGSYPVVLRAIYAAPGPTLPPMFVVAARFVLTSLMFAVVQAVQASQRLSSVSPPGSAAAQSGGVAGREVGASSPLSAARGGEAAAGGPRRSGAVLGVAGAGPKGPVAPSAASEASPKGPEEAAASPARPKGQEGGRSAAAPKGEGVGVAAQGLAT